MKANIRFCIEVQGQVTREQFKAWLDFQFGIRGDISMDNPMADIEIRDAEIEPYYNLDIL